LDKEIDTQESVFSFGLCLRKFSEKEVSTIKEEKLSPLSSYLDDKARFLGDTAKRIPESPTGLDLTHHIICIDDAEFDFGCGFDEGSIGQVCNENCNQKKLQSFEFQLDPTLFQSNKTIFGNQVEIKRDKLFFGYRKTLLPGLDRDIQPVFLRCKGASKFFIVGAKRIRGSIEIDQNFLGTSPRLPVGQGSRPSGHGFNIEITSLGICLCSRSFVLKGKKKFPAS
jgi:hypothetical protein